MSETVHGGGEQFANEGNASDGLKTKQERVSSRNHTT